MLRCAAAAFFLACGVSTFGNGQAPTYPLARIEATGLHRFTLTDATRLSGLKVGQPVGPREIDAAVAQMLSAGVFKAVRYRVENETGRLALTFEIEEETDWSVPVIFDNFIWMTDDELNAAVREAVPAYDGTAPVASRVPEIIVRALTGVLRRHDMTANVEYRTAGKQDGSERRHVFTVSGTLPTCSVHIEGATKIKESDLLKIVPKLAGQPYSRSYLAEVTQKSLKLAYQRRGYWHAAFQPPRATPGAVGKCAGALAGALQLHEREEISRGVAAGLSVRAISRALARAPSTVSRELRRHGGRVGYRAEPAEQGAWRKARRPKPCRLAQSPRLRKVVGDKLAARWSPEQIAGWLKRTYPDSPSMQVSHETIYRSLFIQSRGVLKQALIVQLRRRRMMRRAQQAPAGRRRHHIPDALSIRERPAEIEDRAIPGHWEGDLLAGTRSSQIATLVERQSRYVMLVRVPNKETATVVQALTQHVHTLPRGLMTSLTLDRGLEFAAHKRFTIATDVTVYFCDPRSPWQRGSNENTNGLLRQYFPKGTDLSGVSQAQLDRVARQLNQRPRKTLGFATPADKLAEIVASTG